MKQTKKMFPKDRWKRYEAAHLSMKEVKNLIVKLGLIKKALEGQGIYRKSKDYFE